MGVGAAIPKKTFAEEMQEEVNEFITAMGMEAPHPSFGVDDYDEGDEADIGTMSVLDEAMSARKKKGSRDGKPLAPRENSKWVLKSSEVDSELKAHAQNTKHMPNCFHRRCSLDNTCGQHIAWILTL